MSSYQPDDPFAPRPDESNPEDSFSPPEPSDPSSPPSGPGFTRPPTEERGQDEDVRWTPAAGANTFQWRDEPSSPPPDSLESPPWEHPPRPGSPPPAPPYYSSSPPPDSPPTDANGQPYHHPPGPYYQPPPPGRAASWGGAYPPGGSGHYPPPGGGYPPSGGGYPPPGMPAPGNAKVLLAILCALGAMVLGTCCQPFGLPFAVLLGIAGIVLARRHQKIRAQWGYPSDSIATLAIVLSVIGLFLSAVMFAWSVYLMRNPEVMQSFFRMMEDLQRN